MDRRQRQMCIKDRAAGAGSRLRGRLILLYSGKALIAVAVPLWAIGLKKGRFRGDAWSTRIEKKWIGKKRDMRAWGRGGR